MEQPSSTTLSVLHALFDLAKSHRPTTLAALAHRASSRTQNVTLALSRTALIALERDGLVWLVAGGPRLTMSGLAFAVVTERMAVRRSVASASSAVVSPMSTMHGPIAQAAIGHSASAAAMPPATPSTRRTRERAASALRAA